MTEQITQQFRLYDAESRGVRGHTFPDGDELRIWLFDTVIDAPWFVERFPHVIGIDVHVRKTNTHGSVGSLIDGIATMEFAPIHMCEQFVLHELAHCCVAPESKSHDPIFAQVYLELIYRVQGVDAWLRLRTAFQKTGICFDPRCQYEQACICGSDLTRVTRD